MMMMTWLGCLICGNSTVIGQNRGFCLPCKILWDTLRHEAESKLLVDETMRRKARASIRGTGTGAATRRPRKQSTIVIQFWTWVFGATDMT